MSTTSLPLLSSRRQLLGAGLTAALGSWVALELLDASRASAWGVGSAGQISVVGDSLTSGTLPYQADALADVGWTRTTIDAYRNRGVLTKMNGDKHTGLTAVDAIRRESGDSDLWVVALGSNDAGSLPRNQDLIRRMMDRIGGGHHVLWVNIYLRSKPARQEAWNAALDDVANDLSDGMFIYDWASVAAPNPQWLADDQIHCTPSGYKHRATEIAMATRSMVPSTPIVTGPLRARRPGATNAVA
ncbi:MAG: GDSL-type esterase/lipase family protein [Ilumatobacteraceae bacterium]